MLSVLYINFIKFFEEPQKSSGHFMRICSLTYSWAPTNAINLRKVVPARKYYPRDRRGPNFWHFLVPTWTLDRTCCPDGPVRGPIIIIMPNEDDNIDSMLVVGPSFNDAAEFAGWGPINHCRPVSPFECHLIFYGTPAWLSVKRFTFNCFMPSALWGYEWFL